MTLTPFPAAAALAFSSALLHQVPSGLRACTLSAHGPWNSLPSLCCLVDACLSISSQLRHHLVGEDFPYIQKPRSPFINRTCLSITSQMVLHIFVSISDMSASTPKGLAPCGPAYVYYFSLYDSGP